MSALSPLLQFVTLGVSNHAGRYDATVRKWTQVLIRNDDGVVITACGFGDDPDEAMRAALVDFRQQIARALGGVAMERA